MRLFWLKIYLCLIVILWLKICLLYGGGREDVDHLFCYCPFSNCIWYDLYSKCLIPFRHPSWVSTISRLSFSGRGSSIKSLIIRLMLAIVVYYQLTKKKILWFTIFGGRRMLGFMMRLLATTRLFIAILFIILFLKLIFFIIWPLQMLIDNLIFYKDFMMIFSFLVDLFLV